MDYIGTRLDKCMQAGNLTVSDLARWFKRPFPTVVGWRKGRGLGGAPRDIRSVLYLLEDLEKRIVNRTNLLFPVPELSPRKRIKYLGEIRKTVKVPNAHNQR